MHAFNFSGKVIARDFKIKYFSLLLCGSLEADPIFFVKDLNDESRLPVRDRDA